MPLIARIVTTSPLIHEELGTHNVEHLRRHVTECREGDFSGFDCLRAAFELKLATLEEAGTSHEEMQQFYEEGRLKPDLARAEELLAKAREGDFEEFKELADLLKGRTVGSARLGLEQEEYDSMTEQYNLYIAKRAVEECRKGDFTRFTAIVGGVARAYFTLEDIGTDRAEFEQFHRDRFIVPAKRCLEEVRAGNFENVEELGSLVNSGKVGEDLEVSQEELDEIMRPYYLGEALKVLAQCREGDISNLEGLRNVIENGPLTYDELDTSEEEVEGFHRGQALEEMREIADECRQGNYTNLPLLILATELLPFSGSLTRKDVDSLDLEIDVWKRRDEINAARELITALRDRGGLSKAGDIDRQLLLRFTAEELGLSEEEYLLLINSDGRFN